MNTEETADKDTGPVDLDTARDMARSFKALSSPTRVRIISALARGERNVNDLAREVAMSQSAVSHQLRTLRRLRLVKNRRAGKRIYYSLDDRHIHDLFQEGLEHIAHG
ncbi:MAG: ArsR/SmtB family transcription factor [Anaerolineae bacterium]